MLHRMAATPLFVFIEILNHAWSMGGPVLILVVQKPITFKAHFEFGEVSKLSEEDVAAFRNEEAEDPTTQEAAAV